eukprot:Platyproteum_vivax@DN7591_c3_g3_i1.p1
MRRLEQEAEEEKRKLFGEKLMTIKEKRFRCPTCDRKYRDRDGLTRHIRLKHTHLHQPVSSIRTMMGRKEHKCEKCGYMTKRSNDLRKHMNSKHPNTTIQAHTVQKPPQEEKKSKAIYFGHLGRLAEFADTPEPSSPDSEPSFWESEPSSLDSDRSDSDSSQSAPPVQVTVNQPQLDPPVYSKVYAPVTKQVFDKVYPTDTKQGLDQVLASTTSQETDSQGAGFLPWEIDHQRNIEAWPKVREEKEFQLKLASDRIRRKRRRPISKTHEEHGSTTTQDPNTRCPGSTCKKAFQNLGRLNSHLIKYPDHQTEDIKAPPKPVPCPHDVCSKSYVDDRHFQNHLKTHEEHGANPPLVKPQNEEDISNILGEAQHTLDPEAASIAADSNLEEEAYLNIPPGSTTTQDPNTRCPGSTCKKAFQNLGRLNSHLIKYPDHQTEDIKAPPKLPCPHEGCSKSYVDDRHFRNHLKKHMEHGTTNEKRFECTGCDKNFKQKRNLNRHIRTKHPHLQHKVSEPTTSQEPDSQSDTPAQKKRRKQR